MDPSTNPPAPNDCVAYRHRHHNWAGELERLRLVFSNDPAQARYELTRLYGGSGSLNDLILYKNGALLIAENNHFHELRRALYDVITAAKNG
jgi:hypothetical protein